MKRHSLLLVLLTANIGSLFAYDVNEITRRIPEIGLHPNKEISEGLKKSPRELMALSLITLSQEQIQKVDALKLDLERRSAEWENKNGKRFEEVVATMTKFRPMPGEEAKKEHDKWHTLKCQMAQSRPRINFDDVSQILTAEQVVTYKEELATINFWYDGHNERKRIMMLIEVGAKPQEAIDLFENFTKELNTYNNKTRNGESAPKPDFAGMIEKLKADAGSK